MAKNAFPMPGGSGVLSKVLKALTAIALVVLVVKYPSDAAHWASAGMRLLWSVVEGIVTFLRQVHG